MRREKKHCLSPSKDLGQIRTDKYRSIRQRLARLTMFLLTPQLGQLEAIETMAGLSLLEIHQCPARIPEFTFG